MTDNVLVLPVVTRLDIPAERTLNSALKAGLEGAVVVGRRADGTYYFASSLADGGDVLWLLEWAKMQLLHVGGAWPEGEPS